MPRRRRLHTVHEARPERRRAFHTGGVDLHQYPWHVDRPSIDLSEISAIKQVFGEKAYHVPVSSARSMIGHLLGAAGAVEATFSILSIRDQVCPPTINYDPPDPEMRP